MKPFYCSDSIVYLCNKKEGRVPFVKSRKKENIPTQNTNFIQKIVRGNFTQNEAFSRFDGETKICFSRRFLILLRIAWNANLYFGKVTLGNSFACFHCERFDCFHAVPTKFVLEKLCEAGENMLGWSLW